MSLRDKIVSREQAARILADRRARGERIVFTNGCFDLLHAGHALYLEQARALGDCLVVGLNSDESVVAIKGPARPIVSEGARAHLLAALSSVDLVIIFSEPTSQALLDMLRPEVFVKGGDYTRATMNQEEKRFVESYGGEVHLLPALPESSTSRIIERIITAHGDAKTADASGNV
jgi:D-beta-D-heptose 7-phosphate kinase/D-beta-D-heptose 1-phosphate adenosyltransferase